MSCTFIPHGLEHPFRKRQHGSLARSPRLGELLTFWRPWSAGDEVRNWVGRLIESRDGLLSFLTAWMKLDPYGFARYSARSSWDADLEAIEKLVALEVIERKLADIKMEDLEGKQRQAVEVFREAMKRKREGKRRRSNLDPSA